MKPRSLLFTIFGLYVRNYGSEIWVGSLTRFMTEFGFSVDAVRVAISRMLRQGWIESRKIKNKSYYSMTERGIKRLEEAAARIYDRSSITWDGSWNIVSYSFTEKNREKRDLFRKELAWLGFGMLSNNTWVSPRNLTDKVSDFIEAHKIKDHVEMFTSIHHGIEDSRRLVEKSWDLEGINSFYKQFLDEYEPRFQDFAQKKFSFTSSDDSFCFIEKTRLVHQYRGFLFMDPHLPKELLPEYWRGEAAMDLFQRYDQCLDQGASRFFNEVCVSIE